ncbi:MAG: hypothetical protein ACE145_17115 [Terriglobia bacterium]
MIPTAVSLSNRVFRRLVVLYPPDLYRQFGDELADVFSQQVELAWQEGSWRGIAATWMRVVEDCAAVSLPYFAARLAVPMLTATTSATLFALVLWAVDPNLPHCK